MIISCLLLLTMEESQKSSTCKNSYRYLKKTLLVSRNPSEMSSHACDLIDFVGEYLRTLLHCCMSTVPTMRLN